MAIPTLSNHGPSPTVGYSSNSPISSPSPSADGRRAGTKRKRSTKTNGNANPPRNMNSQRELLTPGQKQSNHRNAETRRRQDILERLTIICDELVPGAKGLAKSTELAYTKAHEYLRDMLLDKKRLVDEIEAKGGSVSEKELQAVSMLDAYYAISSDDESDDGEDENHDQESEATDGEAEAEAEAEDASSSVQEGEGGEGEEEEGYDNDDAVNAAESLKQMKQGNH